MDEKKTAHIDLRVLNALSLCASKEVARFYLNGVSVTVTESAAVYVVTDGHRLIAARMELPKPEEGEDPEINTLTGSWIIPPEICRAFKIPKGRSNGPVPGTLSGEGVRLTLEDDADHAARTFNAIDGTFSDWLRVLPRLPISGGISGFSFPADQMSDFDKAGKILGIGKPILFPNGGSPAPVVFADERYLAVIMPKRASDHEALLKNYKVQFSFVTGSALLEPVTD